MLHCIRQQQKEKLKYSIITRSLTLNRKRPQTMTTCSMLTWQPTSLLPGFLMEFSQELDPSPNYIFSSFCFCGFSLLRKQVKKDQILSDKFLPSVRHYYSKRMLKVKLPSTLQQ
ncbi:hypothetical protein Goklo_029350 [Gossypium klotzschianum]|uniref:Uncharacterized protein n=1 Tax=Gossypium klotzschianum TaxID=34286 RepID=A0A7J8W4C9_9ROSI|nr:hypothetical protein [Gossypium klotzschianum]